MVHAVHLNISRWMHRILIVILLAAMAHQGVINVQKQWEIQGEYSNPDQEALFHWISTKTKSGVCFYGESFYFFFKSKIFCNLSWSRMIGYALFMKITCRFCFCWSYASYGQC